MRHLLPLLFLLSACAPEPPTRVALSARVRPVTPAGLEVELTRGLWEIRAFRLRPCPEDPVVLEWPGVPVEVGTLPARAAPQPWTVGLEVGLSVISPPPAAIPAGPWCSLDVVADGPLRIEGQVPETGATLDLSIDLPSLGMPFHVQFADVEIVSREVRGNVVARAVIRPLVVELGSATWLAAVEPGLLAGDDVVVTPDDPAHSLIASALVVGAALYRDPDADGTIDVEERDEERVLGLVPIEDVLPADG